VLLSAIDKTGPIWTAAGTCLVTFLGATLSYNWRCTIISYGLLSRAKSKVVAALETRLPAQLFDAEWKVLEAKQYKSTTVADKESASFFIIIFVVIFFISGGLAIGLLLR
jgi:hypothetical protein